MSHPRADLHSHTNRSDGNTPPRELVRLARAAGVDVLAVTDHDTTEALDECLEEAPAAGVRVIPGIELSSRLEGHDVHVLGYGLDHRAAALNERLAQLHRLRRERVEKICAVLAGLGVALAPEAVLRQAGGKSVGRRHVARAMVREGLVGSIEEAFGRFLGSDSPAYLPAHEMTPAEAVLLVRRHGGIAVLAHPGFLDADGLVERVLDAAPFRGIEVFHRYDSPNKHLAYLDVARRRGLLVTGGSDFHGDDSRKNAPLGAFVCPPHFWKDFEKAIGGL